MNLSQYDKLRKKINTKDFEGKNKGFDKWLFMISILGNVGSVFFSYFLLYPGLHKAIAINIVSGVWATVIAFIFSIIFLVAFEIIKRYLIKSFSFDYFSNRKKIKASIVAWLTVSILMIGLSFYLSIIGSKNLASTSAYANKIAETHTTIVTDSLTIKYEKKKKTYEDENDALRIINNNLRTKLADTDTKYSVIRSQYQHNIDKNVQIIQDNQIEIKGIDEKLKQNVEEAKANLVDVKTTSKTEDTQNIILFIIIAIACEVVIFVGVAFREYYEYNLYVINQQKFEKIYTKKERYRSLLTFVYSEGKLTTGDKVIGGLELKELLSEKTQLQNSNKLVEEFLKDMDRLGVFNTVGKRRHISIPFNEALNVIDTFDETLRILENMK